MAAALGRLHCTCTPDSVITGETKAPAPSTQLLPPEGLRTPCTLVTCPPCGPLLEGRPTCLFAPGSSAGHPAPGVASGRSDKSVGTQAALTGLSVHSVSPRGLVCSKTKRTPAQLCDSGLLRGCSPDGALAETVGAVSLPEHGQEGQGGSVAFCCLVTCSGGRHRRTCAVQGLAQAQHPAGV